MNPAKRNTRSSRRAQARLAAGIVNRYPTLESFSRQLVRLRNSPHIDYYGMQNHIALGRIYKRNMVNTSDAFKQRQQESNVALACLMDANRVLRDMQGEMMSVMRKQDKDEEDTRKRVALFDAFNWHRGDFMSKMESYNFLNLSTHNAKESADQAAQKWDEWVKVARERFRMQIE